ncbi:hypothetical protein BE17_46965 [Sorangium cellulosum]|uniref:Uncharacterized protein n=1 Tax=Sorangium cellulosum TaxID=56 RepID=A0A150SJB1_SORCE|nr:hypothetical protein BE17_46965 [Sorangium cellulosum]
MGEAMFSRRPKTGSAPPCTISVLVAPVPAAEILRSVTPRERAMMLRFGVDLNGPEDAERSSTACASPTR